MKTRFVLVLIAYAAALLGVPAQTLIGTNAPGAASEFNIILSGSVTNLALTVKGTASAYSHVLIRKGSPPTDSSYDFSSRLNGQTNGIYLETPEVSSGTYFIRVVTPAGSQTHAFSLVAETNVSNLRAAERPVSKPLGSTVTGLAAAGVFQYFRLELTNSVSWRATAVSSISAPDLYVAGAQVPTISSYLKRSTLSTNDILAFTTAESAPGVFHIGVHGAGAPGGGVDYTLRLESVQIASLVWDAGSTHLGTEVHTNNSGTAGDYYFRINTANPSLGAWRTALRVLAGEANLYLSRGVLPSPASSDFKSERIGSDGLLLGAGIQFQPSEDWYILVQAKAAAQWTLVSGAPFVTNLGPIASDDSSGSGNVEIGPEGMRFFSATATADILAWRLWLNGGTNQILVKKTTLPLPVSSELSQTRQMLVVPPYLISDQYFIGVVGSPGSVINLDSRQHEVLNLAYGSSVSTNLTGFGYVTYRVQVPPQQIAWQMYVPAVTGNPNVAVRRNTVPNENNNDAYSEQPQPTVDNITLVPPVLSDGTFYITVYTTNDTTQFTLENAPAAVTDINYIGSVTNDDPTRVGWRFYRVTDINQQLGSLGWDLFLTNFAPGTRIALRRNAAPSTWPFRNPPNANTANYYDVISVADFLQRPAHQADVWYIGVYNPTLALGSFTLTTRELQAQPLADNVTVTRTNVLNGRWEFFRVQLTPEDLQGTNSIMGWDLRLVNVTSGVPRIVVRREGFPTNLNSTFTATGPIWPSGGQWAAGQDWTRRTFTPDGATNEDGRILAMGVGRPLEPGTYYIGVLNAVGSTNDMSFSLLSRWIGPNRSIPVQDLNWAGGSVTNSLPPREAAYYRVILPTNAPSWKVRLTTTAGESMMVVSSNTLPNVDSEKRVQKTGKEHYVLMPLSGAMRIVSTTNVIAVVGEGAGITAANRIGSGTSSFVLDSLGAMPEPSLGVLSEVDLLASAALEGGESTAYHFDTHPDTLGFWLFLENKVGNPWIVSRGGMELADPGLGGDLYGNEGGQNSGAIASSDVITVADPYPVETVMVKARGNAGLYADASYTLRVKEIIPEPVSFDGGVYQIAEQSPTLGAYFSIDVPETALGWDLRVTNVTSGVPQIVVARNWLAIAMNTFGFSGFPQISSIWPSAARWAPGADWTGRDFSATGIYEGGRILAMGMGRPLQPGRYYVTVFGTTAAAVSCTLVSRGIGAGFTIPVTDLNFAGGEISVSGLPPREAAYYRVIVPPNAVSWKVKLSAAGGESMLLALKDTLPNVGAAHNTSIFINSGGREMQKLGDEHLLLLPSATSNALQAGNYYLAVVSEGQSPSATNRVGTGTVSYTLTSVGHAPTNFLGDLALGELAITNSLPGGEVQLYQFNVPAGIQTIEARLENTSGNPVMTACAGGRSPDPGVNSGAIAADPYGNEGGEVPVDVKGTLLNIPNPINGVYSLVVKARANASGLFPTANYTLRIRASATIPLEFDQGSFPVVNQAPSTWRYFRVVVPTNAFGWDVRLIDVSSGMPRLVVRRETVPNTISTTPWSVPGNTFNWPTNYQWAPATDWTKRTHSTDGLVIEDGRALAMGLGRPLEPGAYIVGVMNSVASTNMSYTILSRGIGSGFSVPVVDVPFTGSATNAAVAARDAAYYRVVVPSNTPSWRVSVKGLSGEAMLAALRNALPNFDTANISGSITNGRSTQKPGNEHYVMLPPPGQTNIPAGTNYFAVVSEGINPPNTVRIGSGSSSFVFSSRGTLPVPNLGLLTSEDLIQPDSLEGGEVKAYQFSVPPETYGIKVRLDNRVNNPVVVGIAGSQIPDPGAAVSGGSADSYGNEGGYAIADGGPTIVTLPNPVTGLYTLAVKARQSSPGVYPDASYTLRVQEILVPELNFASELNTNGLSNETAGLLQDNERVFFKVQVPAALNGQPVIGWKLELFQSSGLASMRVRRDLLPSDSNASAQMPFTTAAAIIAPPYLTNGTWFVEVKGGGSTAFTLKSSALVLERPAWVMPAPGETNQTSGVTLPMFGDTGIGTDGLPLAGDQSIFLEQGSLHYYAVHVPTNNIGLLRAQLEAISGNPDLYLRVGSVPTLYHNLSGASGTLYDRSMLASSGTEYANWVPLDGKLETRLKPGLWYLAVRAGGNANARYRLRLTFGNVTELPIHGPDLSEQIVAGGDWRYYRVVSPTALPLTFAVTFSQQAGDVWMYLRDVVPPGNGTSGTDWKHWSSDLKNGGPYPSFDPPGTYVFNAPPVRPGEAFYIGFRAVSDSTFTVRVTTNGAPAQEPVVVPFYGGMANTTVPGFSTMLYRVDVPSEAVRWKHTSTHTTNLTVYLGQGTLPTAAARAWASTGPNSSQNTMLVSWNAAAKQYVPAAWPWVAGVSYFVMVTNVTSVPQDFTLYMDGKNAANDDNDSDGLPDAWELFYWNSASQGAGTDADGDGISNLDEFVEGTSPINSGDFRARLFISAVNGAVLRQPELPSYALNSTVTLTAVPTNGYAFIGWTGQATGHANPLLLTMDGHKTVTAKFKRAGDDFITAIPFNGQVIYGTNVSFTKEPGEPNHAGNPGGKSIWWRWVAPASGEISLSTAGSSFNTLLAVYTGSSVSSLTLVAADNNSLGGTNRSRVTFNATAGVAYNIAVDGYNGASSRITLSMVGASAASAPQLINILRVGNLMQFTVSGDANRTYTLETSTNLIFWDALAPVTTAGDGTAQFSESIQSGSGKRFYRARFP